MISRSRSSRWLIRLGWRGIARLRVRRRLTALTGIGVGGGSLVYANTPNGPLLLGGATPAPSTPAGRAPPLGGVGAREAVLQGLETPSYREAIQNVAVAAVVQHPDSGLVLALTRQLAAQPFPAIGLAVLTARGDSVARGAVRRALDDERAWVREWMLAALVDQLEAKDAVALLRETEPALRRPEARTEVTRAISRLARPPS